MKWPLNVVYLKGFNFPVVRTYFQKKNKKGVTLVQRPRHNNVGILYDQSNAWWQQSSCHLQPMHIQIQPFCNPIAEQISLELRMGTCIWNVILSIFIILLNISFHCTDIHLNGQYQNWLMYHFLLFIWVPLCR